MHTPKVHQVTFELRAFVLDQAVGMAGKERSFKKTFSSFPYLPSKGSRVNLQGLSEFAEPVVKNEPWLIENETSFTWVIDLCDPALDNDVEVSAADAKHCIANGWKVE